MSSTDETPGSVSAWLVGLKGEHDSAAQELWNRYFTQLVGVARRQLQGIGRDADEEDVALSALKSAMLGVQHNRFPDLNDRSGLWPLLVTITARKALDQIRRERAQKRGQAASLSPEHLQQIVGDEPSPEFALSMTEDLERLLEGLGDSKLQLIAQRKLEGFANEEIAAELGVSTRTVVRKLTRIRREWDASGDLSA